MRFILLITVIILLAIGMSFSLNKVLDATYDSKQEQIDSLKIVKLKLEIQQLKNTK